VVRQIPNAYVLYDRDYDAARSAVLGFLENASVLTAGRYGRWEYSSMEDAILAGRDAAAILQAKDG
jgi:protoporphyrinogen oxidase